MRKVLVTVFITGSLASAAAWSPRDAISAVCVAREGPTAWRGSPAAAEAPKAIPGENGVAAGRDRSVEMMLSGAVLCVILGARLAWAILYAGTTIIYHVLGYPDGEEDDDVEPDEDDEDDEDEEAILNAFVDFLEANRHHMVPRKYGPEPFSCDWVPSNDDAPLSDIDSDSDGDY